MPEPDNNGDSNLMTLDIIENLIGEIEGKIKELKPNTNMDMLKSLDCAYEYLLGHCGWIRASKKREAFGQ